MTGKFASWVKANVLFAALCSTSTMAFGEDSIHATVNSDGSLSLKGTAQFFDLDFGGADASSTRSFPGKLIKTVTLAKHFYINGENSEMLLPLERGYIRWSILVNPSGIPKRVRSLDHYENNWLVWYDQFTRILGDHWLANVPGQEQVVLELNSNKQLHIEEEVVFIPAVSADDRFVTQNTDKTIASRFSETVKAAVANVSGTDAALFPKGSTAKSVTFLATFVADHDLSVSVPDLRVESIAAQDERSLRIVRLCTILEAGFLYDQADHLRTQLKQRKLAHRFIPLAAPHTLLSIGPGMHKGAGALQSRWHGQSAGTNGDDYYLLDGLASIPPLNPIEAKTLDDFFDRCLSKSNYSSAEKVAKKLVTALSLAQREGIISSLAEPGR